MARAPAQKSLHSLLLKRLLETASYQANEFRAASLVIHLFTAPVTPSLPNTDLRSLHF